MLNIAIAGSTGRMGRTLLETIAESPDMRLSAALEQKNSPFLGKDAGELIGIPCGVSINADTPAALSGSDVLIDFTRPAGTLVHLAICRKQGIKMVIGTTGFTTDEKDILKSAANEIAIVFAPNMSVGVNIHTHYGMATISKSWKRIIDIKLMHLRERRCVWVK
jgi:4-hydroxy-tetrahydrodipicolinate reductase